MFRRLVLAQRRRELAATVEMLDENKQGGPTLEDDMRVDDSGVVDWLDDDVLGLVGLLDVGDRSCQAADEQECKKNTGCTN